MLRFIDVIIDGMRTSAKLGVFAAAIALAAGVVLGAVAALQRNKLADKVIMVLTTAFISMPSFIIGSLMVLILSVKLGCRGGHPIEIEGTGMQETVQVHIAIVALYDFCFGL